MDAGNETFKARVLRNQAEAVLEANPDHACALMDEAIERWPNSAELCLFAARCAKKSTEPVRRDSAVHLAHEAFSINSNYVDALAFAIKTLVERGNSQDACELFLWTHVLDPRSFDVTNLALHIPGRAFRAFRMMFAQRAFFLRPWGPGLNNILTRRYKKEWKFRSSITRKNWLSLL